MRYFAVAAGLAFFVSTMPVLGPAWAQRLNPAGTPQNVGSSALPEGMLVNDFGKCSINDDLANFIPPPCKLGLEGIVSKRRDSSYRSGRSKTWLKVKIPTSSSPFQISLTRQWRLIVSVPCVKMDTRYT